MISDRQKIDFFENGYIVVPDVVPLTLCEKAIEAIVEYLDIDLSDDRTWYRQAHSGHGIVPLHHHQAFWDIRQSERVHEVFTALYDDERLWVSMDRASYKPPGSSQSSDWQEAGVHWDCDPFVQNELSLQGLVYLTDTRPDQGAFCCVPSIYQNLTDYLVAHKDDSDRRKPNVDSADLLSIEGPAGSLVVFNRLMPHSSGLNHSMDHRFVQYVTMQPIGTENERTQRVREWSGKLPPQWAVEQNIENQEIPEAGPPAELSELGKKLAGVESWRED
jgi:hypothetical protein